MAIKKINVKGIETQYQGTLYRSRLEARWASFFDMLGWRHEYEPFDLSGWIPDFCLFGMKQNILVEVKPHSNLKEFDTEKLEYACAGTEFERTEILLLGISLWEGENYYKGATSIGWLGATYPSMEHGWGPRWYAPAILNRADKKSGFGFYHSEGCYGDRITGLSDGDHFCCPVDLKEALLLWNRAKNKVRWKP